MKNSRRIENDLTVFTIDDNGEWQLLDRISGTSWSGPPGRFGTACIEKEGEEECLPIRPYYIDVTSATRLRLAFHDQKTRLALTIRVELAGNRLDIACDNAGATALKSLCLLDELRLSGQSNGYVLPVRSGLFVDAGSGKVFDRDFTTYSYEGLDLAMFGALQDESCLLVKWDDPYTSLSLKGDGKEVSATLRMEKSSRRVSLIAMSSGGINDIALVYRQLAIEKGFLMTWRDKMNEAHECEKLFGAINFKIWFCMLKGIDLDLKVVSSSMLCSFEEAADIADHLKNELKLDRALFILGGWSTMGYDAQHPDVMPANEECGGTEGLRRCADRVKALGYLFGLHDNYQDMYRDAPSWDEDYLMRLPDGEVNVGDVWNGGLAFRICSKRALELAARPQNMPKVKAEVDPSAYFTDTTFAARLYECFSLEHPLTLWDDMHYKQQLASYTRDLFGIYGSECGREWALGVADFFEGATGAQGRCFHNLNPSDIGAFSVPFFEMVFHDCIANYGKYHYNVDKAADYVAHHATIGRTLNYHFGPDEAHLYWKTSGKDELSAVDGADPALYCRAHNGWAEGMCKEDRFMKNTYELLSPLNFISTHQRLTDFQFLNADRTIYSSRFGGAIHAVVNRSTEAATVHQTDSGGAVKLPPYGMFIESDIFIGFCALSFGGKDYNEPALFTLSSTDGRPLADGKSIRVYHGFGDDELHFGGKIYSVAKEAIVGSESPGS